MTISAPRVRPARPVPVRVEVRPRRRIGRPVVGVVLLSGLLRIPYLHAPMSPDEGGFLVVARAWHAGAGSLYGPYWVDRPPLLLAVFRLADALGGFTALRVVGCVAVALTVLGVAVAAAAAADDAISARRASTWAALVSAALLVTPTGGSVMVNGELLAAPFIAWGVALAVHAVRGTTGRLMPWSAAAGCGACAAAAALVKQNMLDVVVLAVALGVAAAVRGHVAWSTLARRTGAATAGGLLTLGTVLAIAWARGTTPGALYFAMYPFRARASELLQTAPSVERMDRFGDMLLMWGATGAPLLIAAFLVLVVARRGRHRGTFAGPMAFALVVTAAYDAVSIWAGGSYWSHYVIQLAVPTGLMAGWLLGHVPHVGRATASVVVACSLLGWGAGFTARTSAPGPVIGAALRDAAAPGDTVVSMLGDAAITRTSGLASPYRYLWSLPAHVLDDRFGRLTALLDSPQRPTWVVVRGSQPTRELMRLGPGEALEAHYAPVSHACGREVYLRKGLERPMPMTTQCSLPLVSWNDDHATHHWIVTGESPRPVPTNGLPRAR